MISLSPIRFQHYPICLNFFFKKRTLSQGSFTIGPSGLGGRLGARPSCLPWGGPSSRIRVGLLSCFGRPILPAAGLAGGNCRAGSPAAGQTAIAGAVPAWAAAAGLAVRPLPRVGAWTALESRIPALPACWLARQTRLRRRCMPSSSWRPLWWRWRSSGPRRQPRCWSRPR
jgi:hypothetical protein